MSEDDDQIEHARTRMARTVGDTLAASGWQSRPLGPTTGIALTRTAGDAMMVTAQLTQTPSRRHSWPVEVEVRLGAGYEPAMNLGPLLGMRPVLALVDHPDALHHAGYTLTLHHGDDIDAVARAISTFIDTCAASVAEEFDTPSDIEKALRPRPSETGTGDDTTDPSPMQRDRSTELRLVLVAAAGDHDRARELLAEFAAHTSSRTHPPSEQTQRFIRQLTRWLDAGGPTPAPLTDTLALLPPHPRFPSQMFSASLAAGRQRAAAMKAAVSTARTRSHGADLDQIARVLNEELDRRGVEVSASDAALQAEQLMLEQRPFGRVRTALNGLVMITEVGTGALRLLTRSEHRRTPDDRQRPPRATYHVTADPNPRIHIAVDLDDRNRDRLDHVFATAPRRLGPYVPVDVWLADHGHSSAGGPPDRTAHIGTHRVGTIPDTRRAAYDRVMNAATLFDEDPYLDGRLVRVGHSTLLEIPLPFSDHHRA